MTSSSLRSPGMPLKRRTSEGWKIDLRVGELSGLNCERVVPSSRRLSERESWVLIRSLVVMERSGEVGGILQVIHKLKFYKI